MQRSMRIAVVGGRGFIGGGIVDALRQIGHDVTVISSQKSAIQSRAGFKFGNMLLPETMRDAIVGSEVLVQSVNFPNYPFADKRKGFTFFTFDSTATRNLVEVAREAGVRRYLFIAGVGAALDSPKPYFRAIAEGEQAIRESGLEAVSLRPAFVFGPRDRGINRVLKFARWSPIVPLLGQGHNLEQPLFIDDLSAAAAYLVGPTAPQGVFEIGGPDRMRLRDMLERVLRFAGLRRPMAAIPMLIGQLGGSMLEHLPGAPLTKDGIDFCANSFVANNEPLLRHLDLELTPLEAGLSTYLKR
jgi:uncharacterized protein YbjT (DUF2867 family)